MTPLAKARSATVPPVTSPPGRRGPPQKLQVNPEEGDAPPWDANTAFGPVGTDVDRVDGLAKASGAPSLRRQPRPQQAMPLFDRARLKGLDLTGARQHARHHRIRPAQGRRRQVQFVGDAGSRRGTHAR